MKKYIAFALILLALLVNVTATEAVSAVVDLTEVEGVALTQDSTTRLNVERGDEIDVLVRLTGTGNNSNVEVEAFISGHEPNSETLSDSTDVFDVEAGVSYVKRLKLRLPGNVDRDNYKLRILVSDRFGSADVYNYNLKVDAKRHLVRIKDIVLRPPYEVEPGRALLVTVEVENEGQRDEDGVKVTASIPSLNIKGSEFINELEEDESTTTEEIFLRIPDDARPGRYRVEVEAEYNDRYASVTDEAWIDVVKSSIPAEEEENERDERETLPPFTVTVAENNKQIETGKGGAVYPITVKNNAKTSKSFMITLEPGNWADASVSPSNVVVIPKGESDTFFVLVSARDGANVGPQLMGATVSSGGSSQQVTLRANVAKGSGLGGDSTGTFEIIVIVLAVIIVILGIALAMQKMREREMQQEERQPLTVSEETRVRKYY